MNDLFSVYHFRNLCQLKKQKNPTHLNECVGLLKGEEDEGQILYVREPLLLFHTYHRVSRGRGVGYEPMVWLWLFC